MNLWCVGKVTDMSRLFLGRDTFNEVISGWDTSSVTDMNGMFYLAKSFNGDLSSWDISNVINMKYMFYGAASFNQDVCAWGDKFPYNNADDIFLDSGCTNTSTPQDGQKGPFCTSECD